jgi:hypothetical protein
VELSADGVISRDELNRLRGWLEIDHGVDVPALPFLHETIEQISSDGEVTEDELDQLALAIERVLPKDIRLAAIAKRKQIREVRRVAQRENKRQTMIATRAEERAARDAAQLRAGILHKADFPVAGAFRFEERREACGRLVEDDSVRLEREPDNAHDSNAILVLAEDDSELGYVRREEARAIGSSSGCGCRGRRQSATTLGNAGRQNRSDRRRHHSSRRRRSVDCCRARNRATERERHNFEISCDKARRRLRIGSVRCNCFGGTRRHRGSLT